MKTYFKLITAATLLVGFTHGAMADNRTPEQLVETISPSYRSSDMKTTQGTQFIWVKRIEAYDRYGKKHQLFSDKQGALLPLDKLNQANNLINPQSVEHKGYYRNLQLQLADQMLTVNKTGIQQHPLPKGIATQVVLHGELEVDEFEVSASGFTLQPSKGQSVAMLNN